jgi:hypothetical protein
MRWMQRLLWIAVGIGLVGCAALGGGGQPPTPTPIAEPGEQSLPEATIPGAPAPTGTAAEEAGADEEVEAGEPAVNAGPQPAGTAQTGDILFVRGGQVWRIGADGSDEAQITGLAEGSVIRDLAASPDGRYVAFTLNGTDVAVLDLEAGELTIRDSNPPDLVGGITWAPEADTLFYYRITDNPEGFEAAEDSGRWQMIYRLDIDPAGEPDPLTGVAESTGTDFAIEAALGDGRLLLTELQQGETFDNRLLVFDEGLAPLESEGFTSVAVLDVSPDASHVLFLDQSEEGAEGTGGPLPLYQAGLDRTFDPDAGLANPLSIVPEPNARYLDAQYGPDGVTIAAVRTMIGEEDNGPAIILLVPNGVGGYAYAPLSTAEGYDTLALAWHDDGVVAQQLPAGGEASEIWLVPLDGEAGARLTEGEQPQVVGRG